MELVAVLLLALVVAATAGVAVLWSRSGAFKKSVSFCGNCGGEVSVSPDPSNSRLVLQCKDDTCGRIEFCQVRASALSLFGVVQHLLTILIAAASYATGTWLELSAWCRALAVAASLLAGWAAARFLVRCCAFGLLACRPPPIWQKEIVAYVARPPG
jgi:hypothetical protein